MMYYFIVNESSGRGAARKAWLEMKREMSAAGVPFAAWTTHCAGDATALARAASVLPEKEVKVIVVGGDGTINEVINGITDFERVALGIVPMGSGNDFVRGVGLARSPREAMKIIYHAKTCRLIDVGEVRVDGHAPRRFGISAGVGLDARVCYEVEGSRHKTWLNRFGLGNFSYGLQTLSVVANMKRASGDVRFVTPSGIESCRVEEMLFLSAMNCPREGGGVPIAPTAQVNDGLFTACMVDGLSRHEAFMCLPLVAVGKHTRVPGVTYLNASHIEMSLDTPLIVHADGEVLGCGHDIVFDIKPKALRLLA